MNYPVRPIIFICIPWFYPAYKAGGPVQSIVNMMHELNSGYEFKIFTANTDINEESLKGIRTGEWIPYNDYTTIWYAAKNNRSNILLQQVKIFKPSVLYIVGLFSWHFNILPLLFCKAPKKILSVRGMLHQGALSQKKNKKKIFLQIFKLMGRQKKVIFHATDEKEKNIIRRQMGNNTNIQVAGNFARIFNNAAAHNKMPGQVHLITIALITPMKNYLLVLKALAKSNANIRYSIYGSVKDTTYWQQCIEQMQQLPSNIKVKYYGDIQPQLVPEVLRHADIFIMPSKSENFGHSIIEALSAGLPVITSTYTPWGELQFNKAGINSATTEVALLNAIEFFVAMNTEIYNEWSSAAAVYAKKVINKDQLKLAYHHLFSQEADSKI